MRYAWTREPKRLGFRPSRKPQEGLALSGVVLIVEKGTGYAYVKFSQEDVELLGKKMPYGIGPGNTAFIRIIKKHKRYDVLCSYMDRSKTVHLWPTATLPNWIRRVRYADVAA